MKTLKRKSLVTWTSALAFVVALVAVTAVGCGSDADTSGTEASLALTEADSGKSFTVSVGDTISVVIPGNPTTGYLWESDLAPESATMLTLVGDPAFAADPVGENVVGSGGKYTFTFTAALPGQAELKLKYWRPFEAQAEPEQTFTANITIE